jgi:hypothetical protein
MHVLCQSEEESLVPIAEKGGQPGACFDGGQRC